MWLNRQDKHKNPVLGRHKINFCLLQNSEIKNYFALFIVLANFVLRKHVKIFSKERIKIKLSICLSL